MALPGRSLPVDTGLHVTDNIVLLENLAHGPGRVNHAESISVQAVSS